MVANQTEIKKIESQTETGQYRRMIDSVAIHRERKAENRKKEEKLMNEWSQIRQK